MLWVRMVGRQKTKYPKIKTGEDGSYTFNPAETTIYMVCCDCGLVHFWAFEIIDGKIKLTVFVDEKETEELRKQNYGKLQHCKKSMWRLVKKEK